MSVPERSRPWLARPPVVWSQALSHAPTLRTFMVAVMTTMLSLNMLSITAAKRADGGTFHFEYVTVTLLQESSKLAVASMLVRQEWLARPRKALAVQHNDLDVKKLFQYGIPALIYCFDNNFQYVILGFLQPAELAILWNFKIFATTLLLSRCLGRRYTWQQWAAMVALVLGCAATQAPQLLAANMSSATAATATTLEVGSGNSGGILARVPLSGKTIGALLALFGSCVAASGNVFCEWLVKKDAAESIHVQNVRLYFFGVIMNLGTLLVKTALDPHSPIRGPRGFFAGYNFWVVSVVTCGALNGILVSFTIRYVDNIAIMFSHALAMLVVAFFSAEFFGLQLTAAFVCGGALVLASLYVFYSAEGENAQEVAASKLEAGRLLQGGVIYEGTAKGLTSAPNVPMYCLQKPTLQK